MPRRYRKIKRYRKRKRGSSRRARRYGSSAMVPRPIGDPMPDRFYTRLKYSDINVSMTSNSGVVASNLWSHNSLYDPDVTGAGNQPMGFDQLAALYNRYKVYGAHAKITLLDSSTAVAGHVVVHLMTTSTAVSDLESNIIRPNTKALVWNPTREVNKRLSIYRGVKRLFGRRSIEENDFSAAVGTNPTYRTYFHINTLPCDGSSSFNVRYAIQITYYCMFYERQRLDLS